MTIQIKAPAMGESIAEATVAKWLKAEGDVVQADELVAELETDKVNLEVTAPVAGKLVKIVAAKGSTVKVGQVMGEVEEGVTGLPDNGITGKASEAGKASLPASAGGAAPRMVVAVASAVSAVVEKSGPAVKKLVAEGASVEGIAGSGKDGRLTKGDVLGGGVTGLRDNGITGKEDSKAGVSAFAGTAVAQTLGAREERVEMTRIRKTIASRLKQAQNTAAMLTTYNEVDLAAINSLRKLYKDSFEKAHGVKLGYMGFFTKAVTDALKRYPALNAEIDGEEIVYKRYHDIGVAVSSDKGLVVPVVRGAGDMDVAGIERAIGELGAKARSGGLKPDDLQGATFSITNGGVFGSLMSMPILNYPQVGILGMHAIKDRPVVVDGQIVIRPMMYVALTYDHRIVDGKEAVGFLVDVKNTLENPGRMLLGV